jgi:hypothetical protein
MVSDTQLINHKKVPVAWVDYQSWTLVQVYLWANEFIFYQSFLNMEFVSYLVGLH